MDRKISKKRFNILNLYTQNPEISNIILENSDFYICKEITNNNKTVGITVHCPKCKLQIDSKIQCICKKYMCKCNGNLICDTCEKYVCKNCQSKNICCKNGKCINSGYDFYSFCNYCGRKAQKICLFKKCDIKICDVCFTRREKNFLCHGHYLLKLNYPIYPEFQGIIGYNLKN